jgi:periplasmic copper chaperone A
VATEFHARRADQSSVRRHSCIDERANMRRIIHFAAVVFAALWLSACNKAPNVEVSDAWSGALPSTATVGAAYMKIASTTADELISAETPIADRVEFHTTQNENGMMQMRELHALRVEPTAMLAFAPGANHMMLLGLKQPLVAGASFPMTLHFKNAGTVVVNIQVRNGLGE